MTGWFGDPAIIEEVTRTENYDLMDEKYILPVITAAFWSEGDQLIAGSPGLSLIGMVYICCTMRFLMQHWSFLSTNLIGGSNTSGSN